MRINRFLLIQCATFCILSSCSKEETLLNITNSQLVFTYEGGIQTITIESNDDWSLYGLPLWLEASQVCGVNTQQISLTAQRNTSGLDREQTLSIRSNNSSNIQTIKVKQYANSVGQVFSVDNTSTKYFNGTTSEKEDSIVLNSSVRWRITGPSWLSMGLNGNISQMTGEIREGSGTIYLRCRKTYSGAEVREDVITLQTESGDETIIIPVAQMGLFDVRSANMRILSDCYWLGFKYGRDTEYIMCGIRDGIVSQEEVIDWQWNTHVPKTNTLLQSNLKPNTYYTICMRGMPSETSVYMQKLNVEVIRTPSEQNQPRAFIENVHQGTDGKWHINCVMNEFAKGYYLVVYGSINRNKAYYARQVSLIIDDLTESFFTKSSSYYVSDANHTIVTWAVGEDGNLSDVVDTYTINTSNSAMAPVWNLSTGTKTVDDFGADENIFEIPVLLDK